MDWRLASWVRLQDLRSSRTLKTHCVFHFDYVVYLLLFFALYSHVSSLVVAFKFFVNVCALCAIHDL
jgi:hypothetical protein